jgi:hypothetical protein
VLCFVLFSIFQFLIFCDNFGEDFTKFGSKQEMKVKEFKHPSKFLARNKWELDDQIHPNFLVSLLQVSLRKKNDLNSFSFVFL